MAKLVPDAILDAMLDVIAAATLETVCSTQPTTYTEAATTYKLADVVIDSGDFTDANGDTNGRKITVGAQNAVPVDSSATALHVALSISGSSTLLAVTTCTSQALTSGNTVNIPSWDIEISDAA